MRAKLRVVAGVTDVGIGAITSLQTDVKTFVAEGFLAHNTFIVDAHARWFLRKHALLAPQWFRRAVRPVTEIPAPPPPLPDILRGEG